MSVTEIDPLVTLPGSRDRIAILGRTGSGKTHFAAWLLSQSDWPSRPWIVVDYKGDELIDALPVHELELDVKKIPSKGGLYRVRPRGPVDDDAVEALLWKIWRRKNVGLYIDEGHMLPDAGALQSILTQGRSKRIQTILLSQRPSWVNRFAFSEADYVAAFQLNDKRDRSTISSFMPIDLGARPLPKRHCWYYDIARDRLVLMRPVPDQVAILDRFYKRNPARSGQGGRFI